MDGSTHGAASAVVHEGGWWLLGLGMLGFALLVVVLAGVLTRLYLADEVGGHRATARSVRPSARPAPGGVRPVAVHRSARRRRRATAAVAPV